jgi:hypothetical protein
VIDVTGEPPVKGAVVDKGFSLSCNTFFGGQSQVGTAKVGTAKAYATTPVFSPSAANRFYYRSRFTGAAEQQLLVDLQSQRRGLPTEKAMEL